MADIDDIEDIVFAATVTANTGLIGYNGSSVTGENNNHYTVMSAEVEEKEFVTKAPIVNINLYIRKHDNGMQNKKAMKAARRLMCKALKENMVVPRGMYWKSKIKWTVRLGEVKQGFDCTNIRLEVITELN